MRQASSRGEKARLTLWAVVVGALQANLAAGGADKFAFASFVARRLLTARTGWVMQRRGALTIRQRLERDQLDLIQIDGRVGFLSGKRLVQFLFKAGKQVGFERVCLSGLMVSCSILPHLAPF